MITHSNVALPCPFCGWIPDMHDTADFIYPVGRRNDIMQAVCADCGATTLGDDFPSALNAWNRRTTHLSLG